MKGAPGHMRWPSGTVANLEEFPRPVHTLTCFATTADWTCRAHCSDAHLLVFLHVVQVGRDAFSLGLQEAESLLQVLCGLLQTKCTVVTTGWWYMHRDQDWADALPATFRRLQQCLKYHDPMQRCRNSAAQLSLSLEL